MNVSSIAHVRGAINKQDLNSDNSYDPGDAYAQSKLANILFTRELAKKIKGLFCDSLTKLVLIWLFVDANVTVNAVHPGLVDTEIIRHMSFFNSWISTILIKPFVWPFIKSPRQGAQTIIYTALDPKLEKVTGKYFRYVLFKKYEFLLMNFVLISAIIPRQMYRV